MVTQNQLHIIVSQGFVHKGGKLLILKRSEQEIANPGEWVVPGGKVESGHSIMDTLKKEIAEETGITELGKTEFLGDTEFTRPDDIHVVVVRFLVEVDTDQVDFDKNDFTDSAWVDLTDIDSYEVIPKLKEEMKKVLSEREEFKVRSEV